MKELSSHATELARMVNSHLVNHATQFAPTREVPLGPLGLSIFGTIKTFPVRLDFVSDPATNRYSVTVWDIRTRTSAADRPMTTSFSSAIDNYPWAVVVAALAVA